MLWIAMVDTTIPHSHDDLINYDGFGGDSQIRFDSLDVSPVWRSITEEGISPGCSVGDSCTTSLK